MSLEINKNNFFVFILFLILAFTKFDLYGQDPVFSQFYNTPLTLNPAFAGNSYAPIIGVNYRNQWRNISSEYKTYNISIDQFFEKLNGGFGLNILVDDLANGTLTNTKITGSYSYKLQFKDEHYLKIGLGAAYLISNLNWNNFVFPDQLDPQFGSIGPGGTTYPSSDFLPLNTRQSVIDISTGFLLYSPLFYLGIAIHHLNSPDLFFINPNQENYSAFPLRFSLHGGYEIKFGKYNKRRLGSFITPNALLERQAGFTQLNLGAYTGYDVFTAGVWYRHAWGNPDAVILSAGIRKGIFKINYSFDFTVSELTIDTGGTHELGILINLESIYPPRSKVNNCLKLFQ